MEEAGAFTLILHTSEAWTFSDGGRGVSPTMHVFALMKQSDARGGSWQEARLNWNEAKGNSHFNGADLLQAVRLKSRSFHLEPGDRDRLPEHFEMRFNLGDIAPFIQNDGSVTLMVTHSSDSVLKLVSKESGENDWFCPRLVME